MISGKGVLLSVPRNIYNAVFTYVILFYICCGWEYLKVHIPGKVTIYWIYFL